MDVVFHQHDENSRDSTDTGYGSVTEFNTVPDHSPESRVAYSLKILERPQVPSKAFASIDAQTLVELLLRLGDEEFQKKYFLVDCRYPYEYDGGHIRGAINNHESSRIAKIFFPDSQQRAERIPIFYCEFSQHRGPSMAHTLRDADRQRNFHRYPNDLCIPSSYVTMHDPRYTDVLRQYNNHYSKGRRAKSQLALGRGLRMRHANSFSITETVASRLSFEDSSPQKPGKITSRKVGTSPLSSRLTFTRSMSHTYSTTETTSRMDSFMEFVLETNTR